MRLLIQHDLTQAFASPARSVMGVLRLTPRSHEAHHVMDWRVDVDADCQCRTSEDAFGNLVHSFSIIGPVSGFAVHVEGEVETADIAGIVRGAAERFPPELFLRGTAATEPDDTWRRQALEWTKGDAEPLGKLHALMDGLHAARAPDAAASDTAQLFIGAARFLGMPARFVSGYVSQDAKTAISHGWAEAHAGPLGWIGFDPALGYCPREGHVRLACGLDALDAAYWRCTHGHSLPATPETSVTIRQALGQNQSQSQS